MTWTTPSSAASKIARNDGRDDTLFDDNQPVRTTPWPPGDQRPSQMPREDPAVTNKQQTISDAPDWTTNNAEHCEEISIAPVQRQSFAVLPYIIKPPFPSGGGCAAASAGRAGPAAPHDQFIAKRQVRDWSGFGEALRLTQAGRGTAGQLNCATSRMASDAALKGPLRRPPAALDRCLFSAYETVPVRHTSGIVRGRSSVDFRGHFVGVRAGIRRVGCSFSWVAQNASSPPPPTYPAPQSR